MSQRFRSPSRKFEKVYNRGLELSAFYERGWEDHTITSVCMQQASSNQYRYKIREQSCATVSSVAVARQGAQCGARLHRWIKVRSAGHDIPRSTRSMKVGDEPRPPRGNRIGDVTRSLRAKIPRLRSLPSSCVPRISHRIFTRSIASIIRRERTRETSRKKCRSNTYRELSLPESKRNVGRTMFRFRYYPLFEIFRAFIFTLFSLLSRHDENLIYTYIYIYMHVQIIDRCYLLKKLL